MKKTILFFLFFSTFVSCSLFNYLFDDSIAIEDTTTTTYASTTSTTTTLGTGDTTTTTDTYVSTTIAPYTSTTNEPTTTTTDAYASTTTTLGTGDTTTTLDTYVSTTIESATTSLAPATTTTVGPTGGADINITLNIPESGTIDASGDMLELHNGSTMNIEVIPFFTADSYRWFLNGDELVGENSATINIGSSLYLGEYILSVEIKRSNQYYSHNVFFSVIR